MTHTHHKTPPRPFCQMKNYRLHGILIILGIMLSALAIKSILPKEQKSAYIRRIEEREQAKDITFYSAAARRFSVVAPSTLLLTLLIGVSCWGRAHIKRASVHLYKIGDNTVVVHERDLSLAAPIAMGLMNAEQLKQMNGGIDKAFELYERMASLQTKQFKALGTGTVPQKILSRDVQELRPADIPTFLELLNSGQIQSGKPMILGFSHGKPRLGSFLDIYSAAVAGESGSGKTSTMLFLIGSGLISQRIKFFGIDPHYPHPKSLGFKTQHLCEAGLMRMATDKADMFDTLKDVEQTIDNRLKQTDTDETPVVLVIDELAFLAKQSIGPTLARTMERISTEGRKCAVYMLASSQTWLASRTGAGSSVVRDTLTSAYVHRIKPKQANLLLQDKDEADKVKKYVKQAGEVLLCPVNDDSVVCQMPYTTEEDMRLVANMVEPVFAGQRSGQHMVNGQHTVDHALTPANQGVDQDVDLIRRVKSRLKNPGDQGRLADKFEYDPGLFSKVLNRQKPIPADLRKKMIQEVKPADVIPFKK